MKFDLQEFKELLEIRKKDGKESMVKQLEKFINIQEKQDKKMAKRPYSGGYEMM